MGSLLSDSTTRAVYKYSLGLSEQDQIKPHMAINALKEYYGASIGVSGERQKFLSLLQNEEKIHHLLGDKDSQPSCPV